MSILFKSGFLKNASINWNYYSFAPVLLTQVRYAARKGTRARRAKKKVKVEVQKVGFIPHNLRNLDKLLASRPKKKFDDSWQQLPKDDVYPYKFYRSTPLPFQDVLELHRETHHPDIYNVPDAPLYATIELNMQGEKKTRFVENFTRIVAIHHKFEHGEERSILAFTKSKDLQEAAIKAGAQLAGGVELIKEIQNGGVSLQDFHHVVAEPAILPELVSLRGLMRKNFPHPKYGTLDVDILSIVKKFSEGIKYTASKDEYEKDFGSINTIIGKLNMDGKVLEDNFECLIKDVQTMRPKRSGNFISRCLLWSPPTTEKITIIHDKYLNTEDNSTKNKPVLEDVNNDVVEERQATTAI